MPWHRFNSNAELMDHNQRCLLIGGSETIANANEWRNCSTNRLRLWGIRKGDSFIRSPFLSMQHKRQIWCGNMSKGGSNPIYKCRIVCFCWIPTLSVFVTRICQLNWIPKGSGVSFNREVLEDLSPQSQQVCLAGSIGASQKNRRKGKTTLSVGVALYFLWIWSFVGWGQLLKICVSCVLNVCAAGDC